MPHNFRIENFNGSTDNRYSKFYAKSNDDLPLDIDYENRFASFYTRGEQFLERIHNLEVRKDDVWVITLPKCGTTWMLELVWLLMNDLDYNTALGVAQEERCPFIETPAFLYPLSSDFLDIVEKMKSPRTIKSHLPMHILPKALWKVKPKIIYVTRNPKDVVISMFYYSNSLSAYKSKEVILDNYLRDVAAYCPFWSHVIEFWRLRNERYIYFTSFERMKKDLRSEILKIGAFLQKPIEEEQMGNLLDHLSFGKMKNNPSCNHVTESKLAIQVRGGDGNSLYESFIRKGQVGGYKDELTEEMIRKLDKWTEDALQPHGLKIEEILHS